MKWVALAYIITVLVLSVKAKAISDDKSINVTQFSEEDIVFDYQAKISE